MALQTGQHVSVRYKKQSALGTRATGTGGKELPLVASPGLVPQQTAIPNPEVRSDGMTRIGSTGMRSITGSHQAVVRVLALDELLASLCRSAWGTADVLDESDFTSLTTGTDRITLTSGNPATLGVRNGDVLWLTNHLTAGNNNVLAQVIGLTATEILLPAGTLTANASPDSDCEINISRRLTQGVVQDYYTVEQYLARIDQSVVADDAVPVSLGLQMDANQAVQATIGWLGLDFSAEETGSSPILTSPTQYESENLKVAGGAAVLLKDGVEVAVLTGFNLQMALGGATLEVWNAATSPDVFLDNTVITGALSLGREDLTFLQQFKAGTTFALSILLKQPGATAPEPFLSLFLPEVRLTSAPDSPLGSNGAMVGSANFEAGKKAATTGFVSTMIQFNSSAA